MHISESGAMMGGFGFPDGGCDTAIALSDGGLVWLNDWPRNSIRDFLSDDTRVRCPQTDVMPPEVKCYRIALDGGVVGVIPAWSVLDVTLSGWVAGGDIGTAANKVLILGPDAGRWTYPTAWGSVAAFNEQGVGVGWSRDTQRLRIWRDGVSTTVPLPPPAISDWGADINEHGMIGGERFIAGRNRAAVFWDQEVVDLPVRKGDSAEVLAVNDNNLAVGRERVSGDRSSLGWGFVWARGDYYLLDELLPEVTDAGCTVVWAYDINNSNQIAAWLKCGAGIGELRFVRIDLSE